VAVDEVKKSEDLEQNQVLFELISYDNSLFDTFLSMISFPAKTFSIPFIVFIMTLRLINIYYKY
jgi:hypothetical protein